MKTIPSCLHSSNTTYLESLHERFLTDPSTFTKEWRTFFERLPNDSNSCLVNGSTSTTQKKTAASSGKMDETVDSQKQVAVLQLINAYRFRGHRQASLDPLNQYERPKVPELEPAFHGLDSADLERTFYTGSLQGPQKATLEEILEIVKTTYCRTIGAEYMHIVETGEKRWLQEKLEDPQGQPQYNSKKQKHILRRLVAASALEEYLHKKYVGQKRFSLEGGESAIVLLDQLVEDAGTNKIKECVVGMAHRGRLNVLVNILGKHPSALFDEFEETTAMDVRSGDVKYHLGFSSDVETPKGDLHLTLAFNPSHLEIISPVVEGSVRARQDRRDSDDRNEVLAILVHGDAAFAGQGVVMETFNLSQTRGYATRGTIHIVINNQIGFTTSDPLDSRSTLYCTDVAKMVQAPIFHVNGDDPEAVARVATLAMEYRMHFQKDVVIDLVCYRKYGHSEADEPAATQPIMYKRIRNHSSVQNIYSDKLLSTGVISAKEASAMTKEYIQSLEKNDIVSRPYAEKIDKRYQINFDSFKKADWREPVTTSITFEQIDALSSKFCSVPESMKLHRAVRRILDDRLAMSQGAKPCDWGFAETLAYASLLTESCPIRISGQDSARGTFFHRHAVIHDQETGETHLPLQNLSEDQAKFLVINSTLSEEAVLAYEFGYASSEPKALVIWEAQFGDFANGAQVVIDQFIASSEEKWGRYCGLVLLLPHGYDGQGPEHSSARLERYLQLCAEDNMQVVYPTNPAQMFHLLRRQFLRPYRKPLIVMSPKSLLRHKLSVSSLVDFTQKGFLPVIDEELHVNRDKVTKIIVCSGKVYFDLALCRNDNKISHCAILRLEQLYPFPKKEILELISSYKNVREVVWVQEEPRNQGAWSTLLSNRFLGGCFESSISLKCVARPYSASPAVGYPSLHKEQQLRLVTEALDIPTKQGTRSNSLEKNAPTVTMENS